MLQNLLLERTEQRIQVFCVRCCLYGHQEAEFSPPFHTQINDKFPGDDENRQAQNERAGVPAAFWEFLLRLPF